MTANPKEELLSRLENWKFEQALKYAEFLSQEHREVLDALVALWGDTGWAMGGALGTLISYAVECMVTDIENEQDGEETCDR